MDDRPKLEDTNFGKIVLIGALVAVAYAAYNFFGLEMAVHVLHFITEIVK
jgi:hypothetical protein